MTRKAFATWASLGLAMGGVFLSPSAARSGDPAARPAPPRITWRAAPRPRPAERLVRLAAAPRGIEVRRSAAIDPKILAPGDPEIDPRIIARWPGAGPSPIGPPGPPLPGVIPWYPR